MEQPLRRNQFDLNSPMEGDAGAISKRGDVPRQAGHILLHESPHGGEISLDPNAEQAPDPASQVTRTELPAWYNVKFNAIDQVVEQDYGQAFHQEQRAEQVGSDDRAATTSPTAMGMTQGQNPLQAQAPSIPAAPSVPAYAAPVVPVPQLTTPLTANNPIYNAMAHPLQANQPQPIDGAQPVAQVTPAQPQMPAAPASMPQQVVPIPEQPQLTGAVNPSFGQPQSQAMPMLPTSPQFQEPRLPEGKPARIDAQHLLPMAKKHLSTYIRSPWVWLAVGILMILYFAKSL